MVTYVLRRKSIIFLIKQSMHKMDAKMLKIGRVVYM